MTPHLRTLTARSRDILAAALRQTEKPLIAFSGGKDAIVTAHIAVSMGIKDAVCEASFYFARQDACIRRSAEALGLNVTYTRVIDDAWLTKNNDLIFSSDSKRRGWGYSQRQQRAVKRHAEAHGYDTQIFGRRTAENSCPAPIYRTAAGLQVHPLRNWSTQDVWDYMAVNRLRRPWIYDTPYGHHVQGNGPFYSLQAKDCGGMAETWAIIRSMDPQYTPERFGL